MTHRSVRRSVAWWLLGLGLFLAGGAAAHGQYRLAAGQSDPTRPITISADESVFWTEGNVQILILRGVHVEQGLLRTNMKQAVVWMQLGEAQPDHPVPVLVYGEGHVAVEWQGQQRQEDKVFLELKTTEEIRLKDVKRMQRAATEDPFFRTALTERQMLLGTAGSPRPSRPELQLTAGLEKPPAAKAQTVEVIPTQLVRPEQPPPGEPAGPGPLSPDRPRRIQVTPRFAAGFKSDIRETKGEQVAIVSGGVAITVEDLLGIGIVDISTDRAVIWTRNADGQRLLQGLNQGETTREQVEIYLEGHVEIRQAAVRGPEAAVTRLLLADQVFYDVNRNVALLLNAEVITSLPKIPEAIHLRAKEIRQVAQGKFEGYCATIYASRLPSDPDLTVCAETATLEERKVPARGWFNRPLINPATGHPEMITQLWATADDVTLRARDFPFLYLPHVEGDLRDPLGPLEQIRFRSDRVFGTGLMVDWDIYQLVGIDAPPNTKWTLQTDYLSRRGPALGTELVTKGANLFGLPGVFASEVRGYAIYDDAPTDILGGPRDYAILRPERGRFLARHRQEIGEDFTVLAQVSYLSDRNFLEQYYKREFDNDPNQETFVYVERQVDNWAWTLLAEPHIRPWVTEAEWLPKASGYVIGQSLFDRLTYFAHASAGYANFYPTTDIPTFYFSEFVPDEFARYRPLPPSTDFPHNPRTDLARLDLWQELDLPFQLGPFNLVPYGVFDVAYFSQTLAEDDGTARLYGGGGVRASLPFTRIYPDVHSALFNLDGIAHKMVVDADYGYFQSSVAFRELVPLDRLDDDATDQARRDLRAFRLMTSFPGSSDYLLATSPLYDPQLYALRRGYQWNVENLDDIQALRFGVRQRWQTKRGFPGMQHILDWMTLNLEATWFPQAERDNFGHPFAFLQYDYIWHIGDRTTFVSTGWVDPFEHGARLFTVGLFADRPERLQFYLGFTTIDPVGTAAVSGSTRYIFNDKWSTALSTTYDFGDRQNLGNTLVLTRAGSDLQVSFGFTYQPLQNNFGVVFEVLPTLASRGMGKRGGLGLGNSGGGLFGDR